MFLRNLPRGVPNRSGSGVSRGLGASASGASTPTRRVGGITDGEKGYFGDQIEGEEGGEDGGFKVKHRFLPIISGLAIPFSVLLDIPGLTEKVSYCLFYESVIRVR